MLDIKFIQEHQEEIAVAARNKNIKLDLENLLSLNGQRLELTAKIDALRAERNALAKLGQSGRPAPEQIRQGKELKEGIAALERALAAVSAEYEDIMVKVPTITSADTPIGQDDKGNVEIYRSGEPPRFDFPPKSHIELARGLDLFDLERGAKVAGYRGYYVKNQAVSLQLALMMFALEKLIQKGFTPVIPPTLVKEFVLYGSGYFAGRRFDPSSDEIYRIANEEVEADGRRNKEDKFLVGTAEPSLLAYYADEVLGEADLPVRFCGFSQCYRSEIGSYGKDTTGLYRVHEFMKVEQVCLTRADYAESDKHHLEMVEISKELHAELGLPHRVLRICTGDMSAGKYKMFDLEAWMPSRNGWGETGSASNFGDWQARRLNVRYQDSAGRKRFVHMINNTALPSVRPMIAILENFQQADGSVLIPEALRKYMPGNIGRISPKE